MKSCKSKLFYKICFGYVCVGARVCACVKSQYKVFSYCGSPKNFEKWCSMSGWRSSGLKPVNEIWAGVVAKGVTCRGRGLSWSVGCGLRQAWVWVPALSLTAISMAWNETLTLSLTFYFYKIERMIRYCGRVMKCTWDNIYKHLERNWQIVNDMPMVTTIAAVTVEVVGLIVILGPERVTMTGEERRRGNPARMDGWQGINKHVDAWYEAGLAETCAALLGSVRSYKENFGITWGRKFFNCKKFQQ